MTTNFRALAQELNTLLVYAASTHPDLHETVKRAVLYCSDRARRELATPPPEPLRPIPVSERLPGPGDCDLHGRCWVWNAGSCRWWELVHEGMISYSHEDYTHWLPCNAFPIPEVTQ